MSQQQCPICGGENGCRIEDAKNCWCMKAKIPQHVLDRVPKALQSCICAGCVERMTNEENSN